MTLPALIKTLENLAALAAIGWGVASEWDIPAAAIVLGVLVLVINAGLGLASGDNPSA